MYQKKLSGLGCKHEQYGDLVNQTFSDERWINNQDLQGQVKIDETPGAQHSNKNDIEDT